MNGRQERLLALGVRALLNIMESNEATGTERARHAASMDGMWEDLKAMEDARRTEFEDRRQALLAVVEQRRLHGPG